VETKQNPQKKIPKTKSPKKNPQKKIYLGRGGDVGAAGRGEKVG
jgi:hypothetical protein